VIAFSLFVTFLAAVVVPWAGPLRIAQAATAAAPVAALTPDPLSYDDPAMHFRPPDGWTRVPVKPPDGGGDEPAPVAAYAFHAGKSDARAIVITVAPFDGSLEAFKSSHESELRGAGDTFVDHEDRTTLANGMPAYFLKVTQGVGAGQQVRRFEYLAIDLTRSIDVAMIGRAGDFDENDAKKALASLYVVVYPRTRR
jgi:hypothetical protein